MSHDPDTLAFYAREAQAYAARPRKTENPDLTAFLCQLRPDAHILDLGCGAGQDAHTMVQAGFTVTAIDGTPELVAEAEKRLGQRVRVQKFEDLADIEAFDAVWANASLLHVPKPALPPTIDRIHRALRSDGLIFASFKTGGEEGRDALGRYYNYPSKEELLRALPGPSWRILDLTDGEGPGYDGRVTRWLAVLARKIGPLANPNLAR